MDGANLGANLGRLAIVVLCLCVADVGNGQTVPAPNAAQLPPASQPVDPRRDQLRGLEADLKASDEQSRKLEDEIETIRTDRARFNAALIDTNAKVQAAEARTSDLEKQLETARGREDALDRTLAGRRALIGEILAALQRIDRNPPPAVLVSPQDMMRAVHSAMLLGDVLPELRSETESPRQRPRRPRGDASVDRSRAAEARR